MLPHPSNTIDLLLIADEKIAAGVGSPSSLTIPLSDVVAGKLMIWSTPATTKKPRHG